jgi:hypothetical protein
MNRIAILGWGSLLWEDRHPFDDQHGPWSGNGPTLKLEFSRISSSRRGALTLVIDPVHGTPNHVAFAISRRSNLNTAIADLREREGATPVNIGFLSLGTGRHRSHCRATLDAVRLWAAQSNIDAAIWTDLPSNFSERTGSEFSVEFAVEYLSRLGPAAKKIAYTYIRRAPTFIQTPLRRAVSSTLQ